MSVTLNKADTNIVAFPKESRMIRVCEVPECGGKTFAYGLCEKHAVRLRTHGDVNYDQKAAHFLRSKHPLYKHWVRLAREGGRSDAWDDFWAFVADVGERPTNRHKLFRHDVSAPWSKANGEWRAPSIPKNLLSSEERARANARAKKHRDKKTVAYKRSQLLRRYGLTLAEFDAMRRAQNDLCAICNKPETAKSPIADSPRTLAVDHDHVTGKIRGLLCSACNSGIGRFGDDLNLMRRAMAYLEYHAKFSKEVA